MTVRQALEPNCSAARPLPFNDTRGILSPGNRWEYRIQDGFWVSCLDIEPRQELRLEYEKDRPTLNFGFILFGLNVLRQKILFPY